MIPRACILAAAALLVAATPAAAAPDAAARAAAYDDAIVATMKAGLPLKVRVDRFRAILTDYYDMPAIAALVAGPAWAGASVADRAGLVAALTRHSAISLARNFARYGGERFLLDPTVQMRGDSNIVKVTIRSGSGGGDVLYYRMRGGRIIDVISGGVSQLAVQRSDVAATAAAGGVAAVVKRLDQVDAKAMR